MSIYVQDQVLTDLCASFCSRLYCCKEGPEPPSQGPSWSHTLVSLIFVNYLLGLIFVFNVFVSFSIQASILALHVFCLPFDIQIKNNNLREESSNHALGLHHSMQCLIPSPCNYYQWALSLVNALRGTLFTTKTMASQAIYNDINNIIAHWPVSFVKINVSTHIIII